MTEIQSERGFFFFLKGKLYGVCIHLDAYIYLVPAAIHMTPKEEAEERLEFFPLGEVRKLGQAASLCAGSGGRQNTKSKSSIFKLPSPVCAIQ